MEGVGVLDLDVAVFLSVGGLPEVGAAKHRSLHS